MNFSTDFGTNRFVLPGRLRISVPELRGNTNYTQLIECHLLKTHGITKVSANQYTGSVLVFFDENIISSILIEQLIYRIKKVNLVTDLECKRKIPQREFLEVEKTIFKAYDRLFPFLIGISATCLGITNSWIMALLIFEMASPNNAFKIVSNVLKKALQCACDNEIKIENRMIFDRLQLLDYIIFDTSNTSNKFLVSNYNNFPDFTDIACIEALRELGIEEMEILSSNDEEMVRKIAFVLGIDNYTSNMSEAQKAKRIATICDKYKNIAIVKSSHIGMNPSLEMRFATLSKVVNYKPDLIIEDSNPMAIPQLIFIGKYTIENIRQIYTLSTGFNAAGIILMITNSITPFWCLIYRNISSLIMQLNANRASRYQQKYLSR